MIQSYPIQSNPYPNIVIDNYKTLLEDPQNPGTGQFVPAEPEASDDPQQLRGARGAPLSVEDEVVPPQPGTRWKSRGWFLCPN